MELGGQFENLLNILKMAGPLLTGNKGLNPAVSRPEPWSLKPLWDPECFSVARI